MYYFMKTFYQTSVIEASVYFELVILKCLRTTQNMILMTIISVQVHYFLLLNNFSDPNKCFLLPNKLRSIFLSHLKMMHKVCILC